MIFQLFNSVFLIEPFKQMLDEWKNLDTANTGICNVFEAHKKKHSGGETMDGLT